MAEKQTGGLSLRIGLTLSQLESDFLTAEQTIKQGIAALNRQQNIVKLRMETDLAGLDIATDKAKIFEVQERSLNQLLEMQRDRLKLATTAFQDYANGKNVNEVAAKKLETAMERERLAVAKLEEQLKHLQAQKISFDTSNLQSNIDKITAKIGNVRLKAEIDTSKLQNAGSVFEAQKVHVQALTKELELQRQKLIQLREAMYQSAKANGAGSVQTLNVKSNVLRQIQEINQLETKLKELSNTNISLQIRADTMRQVEQTIREDIARINARIESVRVKTEIDTSKLGTAASEFDKAKVHVQGLTQEIVLQNQKLSDLKKALSMSVSTNGLNNIKTINLQTEIQKQIQEIDRLKAKINELNNISPTKTNGLLSSYLNIKGDITGKLNNITTAFNQLQGSTSSADTAITAVLGVIDSIPKSAGLAAVTLVGLPIVFKGIENSIVDLIKASASAGDSVYVMARGFQMSIADTGKFTSMCKTAGVEVNDLASTIKRTQQQIIRGGDNAKAEQWLQRYGESAFDASGHLKNMNEMTLTLSRALKKAQAEGNGMAFILGTMRGASAGAITAIEDAEGVYQQAAGLVKNGLANPVLAHEVQGNLNAMNLQASFMKASFESALLPVANEIIPHLTERMGKMTELIKDNADLIKAFGSAIGNAFLTVEGIVDKAVHGVVSIAGTLRDIYNYRDNSIVERYKEDANVQSAEDLFEKELARSYTPQERAAIESDSSLKKRILDYYEEIFKDIQEERKKLAEEIKKTNVELSNSVADISSAAADRFKIEENPERLKQAESLKKILQETSDIQYKLSHSDYENKKLDLLQWRQDLLNQAETTAEKRAAIEELYAAKSEQIEQERADKLAEIRESISSADKTALEQKLDSIEKEKQAWLKAGMEESEAVALAQKKIDAAYREAAQKAQEHWRNAADIQYSMTHSAFEKELRDIELWKDAQREKADTAEEISGIIAEAAAKEADAFEREVDRIKGKVQSLEDKIFEQEHSRYENDLRKLAQERYQLYQEEIYSPVMIERYYQNALSKLKSQAAQGGDYTKSPTNGGMQRGGNGIVVIGGDQIIDDGLVKGRQEEIDLLADENKVRAQLLSTLPESERQLVAAQQAMRNFANVQSLPPPVEKSPSGFQVIEGDKIVEMPESTAYLQEFNSALQQTTSGIEQIAMPQELPMQEISAEPLQEFNSALERISSEMASLNPFEPIANAGNFLAERLNQAAQDLPTEYFRNLADGAKSVSTMQQSLTDSTMKLIDAQENLRNVIKNLPSNAQMETKMPTDGFRQLSTQEFISTQQDLLNRQTRELERLPASQPQSKGLNFGFDMDTAGTVLGLGALIAGIGGAPITAPIAAGVAALSALGGLAKGTYDNTTEIPNANTFENIDLMQLSAPLANVDANVQSILQEMQVPQETTLSFETIVTPLNNISNVVGNILAALNNRGSQPINISPNMNIDLGGAYVFDESLKKSLVDDITNKIVTAITSAVEQATGQFRNYSYGA